MRLEDLIPVAPLAAMFILPRIKVSPALRGKFAPKAAILVSCGSTVDIPQGGKCKVTFKVKNTGYVDVTFDYTVDILDKNGVIVGSASDYSGISLAKGEEKTITTSEITIKEDAATGRGKVRVTVLDHTTGSILDQESCDIINIVSGVTVEITRIEVTAV